MTARTSLRFSALVLTGLLLPRSQALAAKTVGSFEEVVAAAAADILDVTNRQPVSVGQFTPTGLPDSKSGPAIGELLKAALKAIDPSAVKREAPFEVKGDYRLSDHPDRAGLKVLALTFRVITLSTGEAKTRELTRFVDDNTSIGKLLNVAGPVKPGTGSDTQQRQQRNQEIVDLAKKPKTFVSPDAPTVIKSTKESPFAIEILARPLKGHESQKGEALRARIDPESNLAFVDVPRGDLYEIRAHNASGREVAVSVTIDGLDLFHFSDDRDPKTGKPLYTHLVVAGTTETVVGWHRSVQEKRFDSFLVTQYGQGASSKAGVPATGPIGVIQVAFSASFELGPDGRRKSAGNETGFGPPVFIDQKPVVREIEPPVDFVTVRYTR